MEVISLPDTKGMTPTKLQPKLLRTRFDWAAKTRTKFNYRKE